MPEADGWVLVEGSGLVADTSIVVSGFLWHCSQNGNTCKIYDGPDATSGKLFATLIGDNDVFYSFGVGGGVGFENGLYVVQSTTSEQLTVIFQTE